MKSKECGVWHIAKREEFFSVSAVVRLEINNGNSYTENFTVYTKTIIYI